MKFKKSIAMAMSVLMAAGMLAGCGSNGSTSSSTASGSASSASGEVSTDGVTISIFDKNSGSNTFDDPVAKAIEEKTGDNSGRKSNRRSAGKIEPDADRSELPGYRPDGSWK